MISVVSVTNDVLMRFLGERLHPVEISFFRFFFSMVSILPLMVSSGSTLFKTQRPMMHVLRAVLGALALGLCCYSVNIMPLSENTTIMFCEPLFFLPLAYILLKEKVDAPRWIATIVGFIGLMIILRPGTDAFRVVAFVPMTAAILFALSNVMVKKMTGEHASTMLFYFGVGTTLFALIPLPFFWEMPTLSELGNVPLHGMDLDYPIEKKPSFRDVPKTKKDLEKVISPILKKHSEVSGAFTDFLDLVFGQENKTSPISLKLEVWNALVDRYAISPDYPLKTRDWFNFSPNRSDFLIYFLDVSIDIFDIFSIKQDNSMTKITY
eukprot:gene16830-17011_t